MGDVIDEIIEAAEEVHDILGDGWSESIYHRAMERELSERGIAMHSEGTISVMYKGAPVGRRRPDLFVVDGDGVVVVELKAGKMSGEQQLNQYTSMVADDENFTLRAGLLICFGEELDTSS